jgi:DNA-binding NtrC family response regulator
MDDASREALAAHADIREVENVIEGCVIMSKGDKFKIGDSGLLNARSTKVAVDQNGD